MTIFDIITNITTLKKKADISVEEEREYQFFLINRWLSMHSGEIEQLLTTHLIGIGCVCLKMSRINFF